MSRFAASCTDCDWSGEWDDLGIALDDARDHERETTHEVESA